MPTKSPVAVITGAGSGIGKACAIRFAHAGLNVVVVDRNDEDGQQTVKELKKKSMGTDALFCHADVSGEQSCLEFARQTIDQFGRIDVLVANAGIRRFGTLLDATEED
jgi:NAD(P)-dependent dehydrogenase (short-subunit alcohol dehydrogenase family)